MKFLFLISGTDMKQEYRMAAEQIKEGKVVDVCCGDGYLLHFLDKKRYEGIDFNPIFIKYLQKQGIHAKQMDISKEKIPSTDNVIMMFSLYQFLTTEISPLEIIDKLKACSSRRTIIAESYTHAASFLNFLAVNFTSVKNNSAHKRFNKESLRELFQKSGASKILETKKSLIAIFNK